MTISIDEFAKRATAFARKHPDAVLEMEAPELAVDPKATAHHLRRTCEAVRRQMVTTARLARRTSKTAPDLFDRTAQPCLQPAERQTA